jgi:hypothetical protein
MGKKTKKLHYLNTPIHRIVDGMCIQGGDIVNGDGTSVYYMMFNILSIRELRSMADPSKMRTSNVDMHVQDYCLWLIEGEILTCLNFSLPLKVALI